jgi:hypothetical protein
MFQKKATLKAWLVRRLMQDPWSENWVPILVEFADPVWIIKFAVFVQSGYIPISSDAWSLGMSVPQVAFEVVGAGERAITFRDPTFEGGVHVAFMHGFFVALLVFLSLESLLLPGGLVNATWIAAGELVLSDDRVAVDTRLGQGCLGLGFR